MSEFNKPVVFYSGNTVVRPGDIVCVRGEFLEQNWNAVIKSGMNSREIALLQHNSQSFKLQIPEEFEEGLYTLELSGENPLSITLNVPIVRWMQGDEGETATPDGWVRLQGECLRVTENAQIHAVFTDENGESMRMLPDRVYDDYSVGFSFFKMPLGSYSVTYFNGFAECDCGQIEINVSPEKLWGQKVYDVTEYGLSKYSVEDCTPALRELLEKVGEEGGGILYFPAGRYHLTDSFHIPRGVVMRGAGYRKTQLFWTDEWRGMGTHENGKSKTWMPLPLPEQMITAEGDFVIENLEFAGARIGALLKAGSTENPVKNIRLESVRVNVNSMLEINARHHQNQAIAVLKETWSGFPGLPERLDMLDINGSNIKIIGCHFEWSARLSTYGNKIKYLLMQNVHVGNWSCQRNWMPLGELDKAIIEDNDIHDWDLGFGGDNVYLARTAIRDTSCGDREAFTTDISKGIDYRGTALIDGCRFTFPDYVDMSKAGVGSKLCILSGKGAGQYRFIKEVDRQTVVIESPFDVAPDEQSMLTVNEMHINWYFHDLYIENCGMLQFYVAQGNTVVDSVKIVRSAGIADYGKYGYHFYHNNWYNSYINNELSEGNCVFHKKGWYGYFTGEANFKDTPGYSQLRIFARSCKDMILACTVRGNTLKDNCLFWFKTEIDGGISDFIVDKNHSEDCRCGFYIDGKPERMLMSGNTYERVEDEIIYAGSAVE